tara:strand:- start:199 stop:342 length:144 start_codon:yes stop_codon:yes gene_type:complete
MPFTVFQRTRAIGIPTAPGAGGISGIGPIEVIDPMRLGGADITSAAP